MHKVETWSISELCPWERNPRRISQRALDGLKASLERFGTLQPIVVTPDGTVVGGHQRLEALKRIGRQEVQVLVADLSKADAKAANVALNNQAIAGEFTDEVQTILDEIKMEDEEGFSSMLMEDLAIPEADFEPGEEPEPLDEKKKVTCPECGHEFEPES